MIMNSSYVLISIILYVRLRADEKHVPGYPVKYVILFDFVIYFAIIYLTRQPCDRLAYPFGKYALRIAPYFTRAGALFLIFEIKNFYNQ